MCCPLCATQDLEPYHQDRSRYYFECATCGLVSVASRDLPTLAAEHAEYALHRNSVDDLGYRRFLSRAFNPVVERIAPPATGLDFGCGPGPALAAMLEEHGFTVTVYDPCFAKNTSVLQDEAYDFITCTEVIEHVHRAGAVWVQLFGMLKAGGFLVVMTKRVRSQSAFSTWHYKNDPTHVAFYSERTLGYVAERHGCSFELVGDDVCVFSRRSPVGGPRDNDLRHASRPKRQLY